MTANERRNEIVRILVSRRHETMKQLASELNVTDRTIRTDITVLTVDYPLETVRGNGGCVKVADWYHPHKHSLSQEQIKVLTELTKTVNTYQAEILIGILKTYA